MVSYSMAFRTTCRALSGKCVGICNCLPRRSSRDDNKYSVRAFDGKVLPVYTIRGKVATGTAHPCVVYVGSSQRQVLSLFCMGLCSEVSDNQVSHAPLRSLYTVISGHLLCKGTSRG